MGAWSNVKTNIEGIEGEEEFVKSINERLESIVKEVSRAQRIDL